jgi:outer membrane protein OmpA-like peptidoglycan-associated protein
MFSKRQIALASATALMVWPGCGGSAMAQQFDGEVQLAQAEPPHPTDEGRQPNQKQPPKGAQQQPSAPKPGQPAPPAQPRHTQQVTPGGVQQPPSPGQEIQHRPPVASPPQRAQEQGQPPAQPPRTPQAQERRPETPPPHAPAPGASPQPPNQGLNPRPGQPQTTQQQAPRGVQPALEPNQVPPRPGQPQTTQQQAPRGVQPALEPNQVPPRPGQPQTTQQQAPRGVQPALEPNQVPPRPGQPQTTQQQAPRGVQPGLEPNQVPPRPGQPQTTQQQAPRGAQPVLEPNQAQQQQRPGQPMQPAARTPNTVTAPQQPAPGQPQPAQQVAQPGAQRLDQLHQERHERVENNGQRTVIEEPGRTIIEENGHAVIRHDETERFRLLGGNIHVEQRGGEITTVVRRPDNVEVVTIVDPNGRLLRRFRRNPDGREFVLIDNRPRPGVVVGVGGIVVLPPLRLGIPRDEYIVDTEELPPQRIVETLEAPPLERLERAYTLDEIRYSIALRDRMRRVDLNTINFETGSWEVDEDQVPRLTAIAEAVNAVVRRHPNEMFLIEGHTDAVGSDVDNLSLSDRRAESVALVLTQNFQVPPENLTTQGYGAHELKVQTMEPSRENRRVTIRRITPLLMGSQ